MIARILRLVNVLIGRYRSFQPSSATLIAADVGSGKRIVVVDHSHHQKTKSSSFFIEMLKQKSRVELIWDSSWKGGPPLDWKGLNSRMMDALILFQTFYYHDPHQLARLNCRNICLVPMYDDSYTVPDGILKSYKPYKYISFSGHLHERLSSLGLLSRYVQYFPDPRQLPPVNNDFNELKGFFWQRTNDITWAHIRKLIMGIAFKKFHLHLALDASWYHEVLPSLEEVEKYNITITRWFAKRDDYLHAVYDANIFFAPRVYEGIGMPFLEAMSMGKVVVASDQPTMNEYIRPGETGLLYDIRKIVPVDLMDAAKLSVNAAAYCREGFERWTTQKEDLLQWILDPIQ